MASARVSSPIHSCQISRGSWHAHKFGIAPRRFRVRRLIRSRHADREAEVLRPDDAPGRSSGVRSLAASGRRESWRRAKALPEPITARHRVTRRSRLRQPKARTSRYWTWRYLPGLAGRTCARRVGGDGLGPRASATAGHALPEAPAAKWAIADGRRKEQRDLAVTLAKDRARRARREVEHAQ